MQKDSPWRPGNSSGGLNASDGMARTMAETVADRVVSDAAARTRKHLVDRFNVHRAQALRNYGEPTRSGCALARIRCDDHA